MYNLTIKDMYNFFQNKLNLKTIKFQYKEEDIKDLVGYSPHFDEDKPKDIVIGIHHPKENKGRAKTLLASNE